jgi:hypothetical protein
MAIYRVSVVANLNVEAYVEVKAEDMYEAETMAREMAKQKARDCGDDVWTAYINGTDAGKPLYVKESE